MAKARVELHEAARGELAATDDWYRKRDEKVADRFVERFARLRDRLAAFPQSAPVWSHPALGDLVVRRAPIADFPYVVFFALEQHAVTILAVAHTRRRPGYWLSRIPSP